MPGKSAPRNGRATIRKSDTRAPEFVASLVAVLRHIGLHLKGNRHSGAQVGAQYCRILANGGARAKLIERVQGQFRHLGGRRWISH
tara:strand:+ start:1225 stop:1482 length:258 start_codon:yes stop_codon:yes gene_type:complete